MPCVAAFRSVAVRLTALVINADQPTDQLTDQLRRRSSFRELPARALAYFGRTFSSGRQGNMKKGRAFRPDDDRADLQSPRVATMTGTLSSCSSPSSASHAGDRMDVEPHELGGVDTQMQSAHGLDVLSPRPALPVDTTTGSEFRRKGQAYENDVYSQATTRERHQTAGMRPRAWSRDRSGRGSGGMGLCGSRNAGQRRDCGRGSMSLMAVGA